VKFRELVDLLERTAGRRLRSEEVRWRRGGDCDGRESARLHWGPVGFLSRRVLVIGAVLLAVAGGGIAAGILLTQGGSSSSSGGGKPRYVYPAPVKKRFLDACEKHTQASVCECVVRAYEATMPYSVYRAITLGGVRLNNRVYFEAFTQASTHCSD
jgi:hypothetical protein